MFFLFGNENLIEIFQALVISVCLVLFTIGFLTGYCFKWRKGHWLMYYCGFFGVLISVTVQSIILVLGTQAAPSITKRFENAEVPDSQIPIFFVVFLLFQIVVTFTFNGWLVCLVGSWANDCTDVENSEKYLEEGGERDTR